MLLLNTLSAVVAVASSVAALNIPKESASGRLIEKLHGPPAGWAVDDSTPINKDSSMMKLRVQLVPQNMDKFHELAVNVRYLLYVQVCLFICSKIDCHSWTYILRKASLPACH